MARDSLDSVDREQVEFFFYGWYGVRQKLNSAVPWVVGKGGRCMALSLLNTSLRSRYSLGMETFSRVLGLSVEVERQWLCSYLVEAEALAVH